MPAYSYVATGTCGFFKGQARKLAFPSLKLPFVGHGVNIAADVRCNRITAYVTLPEKVTDISTFRNVIEDALGLLADQHCFSYGMYEQIQIDTIVECDSGQIIYLSQNDGRDYTGVDDLKEAQLIDAALRSHALQFALKDYRLAVGIPSETGLFVQRALENLARHFGPMNKRPDFSITLPKMYAELKISAEDKKLVFQYSGASRHGSRPFLKSVIRLALLRICRDAISNFVAGGHYLHPAYSTTVRQR